MQTLIKYRSISCLCLVLFIGCSEDFLERKPKGQLTFDTFFENQEHAVWATNAIYSQYKTWDMSSLPWLAVTDIISDDADKGSLDPDQPEIQAIDDFQ